MNGLDGVLLLTAGYGRRAEPLSLCRPKALLPAGNTTLLGLMSEAAASLLPKQLVVNASRCPNRILDEVRASSGMEARLLFEERPLGAAVTLGRLSVMMRGSWMLMNTDMILEADLSGLVAHHQKSGAQCTVLCGDFPREGEYGPVLVRGRPRHYLGVCVVEPEVARRAARFQGSRNLLSSCIVNEPEGFEGADTWMDMGEVELYRRNLLSRGCFIHPGAVVSRTASLLGCYHVSAGCVLGEGAVIRDSVMLEGSVLEDGSELVSGVLPWFSRRSGVAYHRQ